MSRSTPPTDTRRPGHGAEDKTAKRSDSTGDGLTRRQFVQSGAALAAGIALPHLPTTEVSTASEKAHPGGLLKRPNFVIIITDQERYPQHWPDGWGDENLPNRKRLAQHGLTFSRAFCASSMCSPSRASIFTGLYPARHGVTEVLEYNTGDSDYTYQSTLQPSTPNMASLLASAGYNVQYRGKWHISKDPTGTVGVQSTRDLEQYGFLGWLPPDSGLDEKATGFGGGDTDYDTLYAEQAAAFLEQADPHSRTPFALIVAFANPHDVMAYPKTWNEPSYSDIEPYKGSNNYGKYASGCFDQGISLPSTWNESLGTNLKPLAQPRSTAMWSIGLGPISEPKAMMEYVNFYAYLHKVSDEHIGTVLDALEANRRLRDNTIVIRFADHGEMGLAHGGMRQKAYNAYEETIHIPLVISNPKLFPGPVQADALASLIDLMPTLATLADVPHRGNLPGCDLTPVIQDAVRHPDGPPRPVQDSILFTTDETLGEQIIGQPSHIRCLREADWKFVMYFDPGHVEPSVYELYNLKDDPLEQHNMAAPDGPYYNPEKVAEMQIKLDRKMAETGTTPP
jgi:choline-sulfatase